MDNPTMVQFFHWYYPEDGSLWDLFKQECSPLAELGINMAWLPPATKGASGTRSVGYDPYDLFDLGEFNQKGTIRTKYGTKEQYIQAIEEAHLLSIKVLADVVLNHKAGADENETVLAVKVKEENRKKEIGPPREIEVPTKFLFQARKGQYSGFIWDSTCFKAVDWDAIKKERAIFLFKSPYSEWEEVVGNEKGNYDYLMFADVNFQNPHLKNELNSWGEWLLSEIKVDGFRLDAAKHITPYFFNDWLDYLSSIKGETPFTVAEFWSGNVKLLTKFLKITKRRTYLFDVPLHYNLYNASRQKNTFDLRRILDNTLVAQYPDSAITFVDNHDTQPYQALESWIEPWFRPLAYTLLLLRPYGIPCVFYPDLYGASYEEFDKHNKEIRVSLAQVKILQTLLRCRKKHLYGKMTDYFDVEDCIGWVVNGSDNKRGSGLAVIMSNNRNGIKRMKMGAGCADKIFVDVIDHLDEVSIDKDGYGNFACRGCSVSVYINKEFIE